MRPKPIGSVRRTLLLSFASIGAVVALTVFKQLERPSLNRAELEQLGTVLFETPRTFRIDGLFDHLNSPFTVDRLRGRWTIFYFGYTFCPDICPVTLSQLSQLDAFLKRENPELAERIRYVMVTVDPGRDTAEKLGAYVPYFNPDFIGVTGDPKSIHDLAFQLSVPFTPVLNSEDEFYLVDHGANLLIINPDGDYQGFIRPPLDYQKLVRVMAAVDNIQ